MAVVPAAGCRQFFYRLSNAPVDKFVPNPIQITPVRRDAGTDSRIFHACVDTVDDFFRIASQQPVLSTGGMLVDGRIETAPLVGGSIFEPWRKDTTAGFERLQSTLQSVRRRALVTVRPAISSPSVTRDDLGPAPATADVAGYVVEVVVVKELEDVDAAQGTESVNNASRHDGTIVRRDDRFDDSPISLGWIPQGRDVQLEQRILQQIVERTSIGA